MEKLSGHGITGYQTVKEIEFGTKQIISGIETISGGLVAVGSAQAVAGAVVDAHGAILGATMGKNAYNDFNNVKDSIKGSSGTDYDNWNKGSFDNSEGSLEYHYRKHGEEVGANSKEQYLRKAEEFAKNAKKGSSKSKVNGTVDGATRYKKNGKYIDIAPDGSIISFGRQ